MKLKRRIDLSINKYIAQAVVLKDLIGKAQTQGELKSLKIDLFCIEAKIEVLKEVQQ